MPNPLSQYNDPSLYLEQSASRDGNLYRAFLVDTILTGATGLYVLDIPVGIDLVGFARFTEVTGETVTSEFLTCTGFTAGALSMTGLNFNRTGDHPLNAQTVLKDASALTGVIAHTPPAELYYATTGSVRSPALQTQAGAQPVFRNGAELPAFRYINTGGATASIQLSLFWQELPNGRS